MTASNDINKYAAIVCFLLGAILYAWAGIATYRERTKYNPVTDQSQLLGQPTMGHAGRPWLHLGPNSGFDSRDGGHK